MIDPRTRTYLLPTRIVWQTTGAAAPENAAHLLRPGHCQATYPTRACCRLTHRGAAPSLLLDFGREIHGGVQIVTGAPVAHQAGRVRIHFGESASEAMGDPNNDHAIHDHVCYLPWCGAHEVGNTGFRFVRLDVLDEGAVVELAAVRAVSLMHDLPYIGRFHCDDDRLNAIWQVGADTVHLCMQDYLWDGIKRDRLIWLGDMYPEVAVINAVFGAHPVAPRSMDVIRDATPPTEWMNTISSYSLWWVLVQRLWYRQHGDRAYLAAQHAYLTALLRHCLTFIDAETGAVTLPCTMLDHPSSRQPESVRRGTHALLLLALEAGAECCAALDDHAAEAEFRAAAARLGEHAPALDPASKQATALLALAGIVDPVEANRAVLAVDPCRGHSPFFGYFILQARARAGDYPGCLDLIRDYWGPMLDLGATTFWEHFEVEWAEHAGRIDELPVPGTVDVHAERGEFCYTGLRHSLCHGWSAGPTAWLSEHVLGVTPLLPGCRAVRIAPHLGDLAFAEGAYPTPYGPIVLVHRRGADGTVESAIDAPEAVQVVLGAPA
ncbi:MAG TPA: alpha-L-rhamnosidase C-terminal domain-containing protein [Armatimonadota bacterium]|nr:alpha-L-rhamnosidase C-terminal domain-containing protein [Armatimonadota bacterium]